ncbi:MAG: hypothetical protein COT16_02640 [Elusimicrobia bacterium CG08_land_8_20_14_0_20_44_26]|nr:MAG: hypothetical protein COT16_02640 [Elusimicrobia bacterium CG08_land_8_20_14_0_20_44_26]
MIADEKLRLGPASSALTNFIGFGILLLVMKFRDKEKNLLIDIFVKSAEYVLAIVILGQIISNKFNLLLFLTSLFVFIMLNIFALFISSKTDDKG